MTSGGHFKMAPDHVQLGCKFIEVETFITYILHSSLVLGVGLYKSPRWDASSLRLLNTRIKPAFWIDGIVFWILSLTSHIQISLSHNNNKLGCICGAPSSYVDFVDLDDLFLVCFVLLCEGVWELFFLIGERCPSGVWDLRKRLKKRPQRLKRVPPFKPLQKRVARNAHDHAPEKFLRSVNQISSRPIIIQSVRALIILITYPYTSNQSDATISTRP